MYFHELRHPSVNLPRKLYVFLSHPREEAVRVSGRSDGLEMSKVCCVCNEPKESKDNVIFTCKGQGCDVSVHQGKCEIL